MVVDVPVLPVFPVISAEEQILPACRIWLRTECAWGALPWLSQLVSIKRCQDLVRVELSQKSLVSVCNESRRA